MLFINKYNWKGINYPSQKDDWEQQEDLIFLRKNTEKYKNFSVPITKEGKRIGKNGEEIIKTIFYKLECIDSARFKLLIKCC